MAPELSEQERALLGRCPLFLGAEDALLRRLPPCPASRSSPSPPGTCSMDPASSGAAWACSSPDRSR